MISGMENKPSCMHFCEHFNRCGGCSFQDVPYEAQLSRKQEAIEAALEATGFDARRTVKRIIPPKIRQDTEIGWTLYHSLAQTERPDSGCEREDHGKNVSTSSDATSWPDGRMRPGQ